MKILMSTLSILISITLFHSPLLFLNNPLVKNQASVSKKMISVFIAKSEKLKDEIEATFEQN